MLLSAADRSARLKTKTQQDSDGPILAFLFTALKFGRRVSARFDLYLVFAKAHLVTKSDEKCIKPRE